ncbi:RNA-directed DNA polymerase from mobile element jockey [Elysia marginata]|uniref:RNA-directed DNA polymerase from mobile element jockey n=1 Tax=Elysia marginata TaxID=1093978 RepID=A0AAV4G7X7_9GAST|nr:RNA-directed DNA polymerase from mobile element jockey [Elysia marginata]
MWTLIHQICSRNATNLHIPWIPGHCGIAGNDEADHLANQGQIEDQREVEIDLKTAKAVSKRHVLDTSRNTPTPHSRQRGRSVATRVVLTQLRCNGESPILQKYLYDIGASPSDACLQCGQSPEDLHHALYNCPEVDFFQSLIPGDPMESLWESPVEMIEFLRVSQRLPIA